VTGKSKTYRILTVVAAALGVNLLLFGLAPVLSSERAAPQDISDPIGVNLVNLAPPKPQQKDPPKKREKPKEKPKADFTPDLIRPQLAAAAAIDVGVSVNLGNFSKLDDDKEFVFEAYELDQAPQPVVRVPPVYPYRAREQQIEGIVQVKLLINTDGTVGQIIILDARPEGIFDESVLQAIPQWKFNPGKIENQAVTAWVVTTLRFDLSGDD
jgi:protein TonB